MNRFRLGVAARVVLNGFLLLVLVAISAVLIERFVLRPEMHRRGEELTRWLAEQAAEHRDDRAQLAADLARVHEALHLGLSLYDRDGRLIGTNVNPPLSRPSAAALPSPSQGHVEWIGIDLAAVQLLEGGLPDGYMVMHNAPPSIPLDLAVKLLFLAILAVAIASVPLTRSMLRPLRELRSATHAYSAGDSDARVDLRRNDEFGDVACAFNEMVDHIEALRRAEKQLLANVSHELRTPLARVRVLLELASDGAPGDALTVLPEIAQDLGELETLVDDVLTTARLDLSTGRTGAAFQIPMHFRDTDPQQLVRRWSDRFRLQRPEGKLTIECPQPLPPSLRCDPVLLRRAVDNLLDNAARYSPNEQRVELRLLLRDDRLRIEVVDHGVGIADGDLDRVFEPFYRVERSRDRRSGGVGLGLSLARRIVEAHGGSLMLQSVVNEGTRAIVEVPFSGAGWPGELPLA